MKSFAIAVGVCLASQSIAMLSIRHFDEELENGACTKQITRTGDAHESHLMVNGDKLVFDANSDKYFYAYNDGAASGFELTCAERPDSFDPMTTHLRGVPEKKTSQMIAAARNFKASTSPKKLVTLSEPSAFVAAEQKVLKNLVLMIQWSDHTTTDLQVSKYEELFNSASHGVHTPTGSVQEYFLNQSYGGLKIESVLSGWQVSTYSERDVAGEPQNGENCNGACSWEGYALQTAIMDAITSYEAEVGGANFAQFDGDNDGYVDMITVVHSGRAAEGAGSIVGKYWIWSHKYILIDETVLANSEHYAAPLSGLKFFDYNINPGRWGNPGDSDASDITHIGVPSHEMTHFLGLADFYDTDYSSSGVGNYDLMANSWGVDGQQRLIPSLGAASKILLGWADSTPLTASGVYTLDSIQESAMIYSISLGNREWILIENRRPVGNEILMHGGILVWHLDMNYMDDGGPSSTRENQNELDPNAPSSWAVYHPALRLIQADGSFDLEGSVNSGDDDDFFGVNLADELSDNLLPKPNLNNYANMGTPSGISLSGFTANADSMNFTFAAGESGSSSTSAPTTSGTSSPTTSTSATPAPTSATSNLIGGLSTTAMVALVGGGVAAFVAIAAIIFVSNSSSKKNGMRNKNNQMTPHTY